VTVTEALRALRNASKAEKKLAQQRVSEAMAAEALAALEAELRSDLESLLKLKEQPTCVR
jgi:hypothetical protein